MTASGGTRQTRNIRSTISSLASRTTGNCWNRYHDETRRAVLQQLMTYHRNPLFEDQGTRSA